MTDIDTLIPANLPAHVQRAFADIASEVPHAGPVGAAEVLAALHRRGLLAGDRDCTCNRSEDGQRVVTHQRGDVDFCRDTFEPVVPDAEP